MDPVNKYVQFYSLAKERKWPIDPDHAIGMTIKVQRTLNSHFIMGDTDLVRYPDLVNKVGYTTEDCSATNLGKYFYVSTAKNKCWVVFQKVVIGEGQQTKARIALELFSGEVDVLTEHALSDNKRLKRFESQVECLRRLHNKPFVLQFKDYYFARSDTGHLFGGIFAKYCQNGDLLDHINHNGPSPQFIPTLIEGVKNLHAAGIIHRDLKSENIFLDENNEIHIGDFGFACVAGTNRERLGTPSYLAPEIVNIQIQNPITQKIDIWSLGVLIYSLIYKTLPPHAKYLSQIKVRVTLDHYKMAYKDFKKFYESLSTSPIRLFIKQFLEIDPSKRLSIYEIKLPEFFLQTALKPLALSIPNPDSVIIPEGLAQLIQRMLQSLPSRQLYDIFAITEQSSKLEMTDEELKPFEDVRIFPQALYSVWVIFQKAVLHVQANRITYLACELFGKQFAAFTESTLTNDYEEKQAGWEMQCLGGLQGHPNIQKVYAACLRETPETKVCGLFAERMNYESLQDRLNSNKALHVKWLNEIINAVKIIHESGFAHRNLQLESLYIRPNDPNEEIIIGDFSNACPANENPQELAESLYYMAPELLVSPPHNSQAQDIWSLGITFYCLMTRRYPPFVEPFANGFSPSAAQSVLEGMKAFCEMPASHHLDEAFLQQFFVMDPQKRPQIGQVKPYPSRVKRR
jgi:serine/threonine protein kinase